MRNVRPIENRSLIVFLRSLSMKKAIFMDGKVFSRSPSMKMGDFVAGKIATKKRHPRKDVSITIW